MSGAARMGGLTRRELVRNAAAIQLLGLLPGSALRAAGLAGAIGAGQPVLASGHVTAVAWLRVNSSCPRRFARSSLARDTACSIVSGWFFICFEACGGCFVSSAVTSPTAWGTSSSFNSGAASAFGTSSAQPSIPMSNMAVNGNRLLGFNICAHLLSMGIILDLY